MIELFIIITNAILVTITLIISSRGILYDKRRKWYNRLNWSGKTVIVIGLVMIGLNTWQFFYTKSKNELTLYNNQKFQLSRDSVISAEVQIGVEQNRRKLFSDLSEAFAKQNMRLDTVSNNIQRLKDSTFQEKIFNPIPETMFFTFDLVIDYQYLPIKDQLNKTKRNALISRKDTLFSFDKNLLKLEIIDRYVQGLDRSVFITIKRNSAIAKYSVEFNIHDLRELCYINNRNELIFRFDIYPFVYPFENGEVLNLQLKKPISNNFISTLDFENASALIGFGTLYYDRMKNVSEGLKVQLRDCKIKFDKYSLDYVKIENIHRIPGDNLGFRGATKKLVRNSLDFNYTSPTHDFGF